MCGCFSRSTRESIRRVSPNRRKQGRESKVTPGRRHHRAVTLIEAVLYISVALALIVGGLVVLQQASIAARTSAMVHQLSAVVAETRVLIRGSPLPPS